FRSDSRTVGAVADGITADFCRRVEIGELRRRGGDFLEPPDFERIGDAGKRVDGNNRAAFGSSHSGDEWIDVSTDRIRGSVRYVTGETVVSGGWRNSVADERGAGEGGLAIAFEKTVAAVGLGHQADVPDATVIAGKFEERAIELVAAEGDEEALA